MEKRNFDPAKLKIVDIQDVEPNGYNPKKQDTREYQEVLESIRLNGLITPIIVRELDDGRLIIVDGAQRHQAAFELGYKQVYIYNLGNISDDEAKSLTLWMETQVPFDNLQLKPLVIELTQKEIKLPQSQMRLAEPREIKPRREAEMKLGDIHTTMVNWKPILRALVSAHYSGNNEMFDSKTKELIDALEKEGNNDDLILFLKSQLVSES